MFFNQKGIISMIRFGLPYLLSAISSLMSGQFRTETELKPLFSCNFKHVHYMKTPAEKTRIKKNCFPAYFFKKKYMDMKFQPYDFQLLN